MTVHPYPATFIVTPEARIAQLERRLARERQTRLDAEAIAERGLREAFLGNMRMRLLSTIADAANESIEPLDLLRFTIAEVCGVTGWSFANVLLRNGADDDERLEACGIWYARNPDQLFGFAEQSRQLVVWPCASAPGRLLIDKHSVWTRDVAGDAGFCRSESAKRAHLRSSVSVPVLQGSDVVAAMEFFSPDQLEPELELLEVLTQIGKQVGRVFKRKANERKLIENALHDSLTGLPNRALFEQEMNEVFAANHAAERLGLSLIYLDLDGFKLVNDALGHHAGDQLLIEMAERLRNTLESFVSMPYPGTPRKLLLARMGGDEFTVLIDAEENHAIALNVAAALHQCLRSPLRIENNDVHSAASLGIAHDDGTYLSAADLLQDADVAMYDAKAQGNECTVVFDQTMRAFAVKRLQIEAGLRRSLEVGGFSLFYQPIIDLSELRLVGFEALLRWTRDGEIVLPDEFLPIAEASGLMNVIGTWVLREACRTAAEWRAIVGSDASFYLSINVAPSQFLQPNFMDQVRDIILATNVDPYTIVIELTESAAVINPSRTARMLEELRAMGIRLSLDDFGTGYSSFSHLKDLPFDTLKIDRSFISGDNTSNSSWNIVDAMMKLAQAMNIKVVAEGIESQFQLDRLKEIGCDCGQGFLFDRAMTADRALNLLQHSPGDTQ